MAKERGGISNKNNKQISNLQPILPNFKIEIVKRVLKE